MSYRNRRRTAAGLQRRGSRPDLRLVGAEVGKGPGIRVFKVTDGVPFTMGKVDSRRILHPEMGAKKLTLNYAVSNRDMSFHSTFTIILTTRFSFCRDRWTSGKVIQGNRCKPGKPPSCLRVRFTAP